MDARGDKTVRILAAVLVGVSGSTTLALLLASLLGALTPTLSAFSLCAGCAAGFWIARMDRRDPLPSLTLFDDCLAFFFLLFCFRQFFWLFFSKNGEIFTLNSHNYGDLPTHVQYIRYLANGAQFWPEHPEVVGEAFRYPFGMDMFAALFVSLGIPVEIVLPTTGFLMSVVVLFALLYWGRGFTVGGFMFSGGITGFAWVAVGVLKDYQATVPIPWISLPTTLLIPQRGFLFGFPCGLVLLWSWRRRFLLSDPDQPPLPKGLEGGLWGFLPLFHLHTFMAVSAIFAIWVLCTRRLRESLPVFLCAVVPATLEVLVLTDLFRKGSMLGWKVGWLKEEQNLFPFLLSEFGFFIFLALFSVYYALTSGKREHRFLFFPGLGIFVLCFFVLFAPWAVDNLKIMVWGYLLMLPVMGDFLEARLRLAPRLLVCGLLFFSGFLAVFAQHHPSNAGVGIANAREVESVCHALKDVPAEKRFATVQSHTHPVAYCGHPLVVGYGGHLWTHGIDIAEREAKLKRLMMGDPEWKTLATELQAHYLFWGGREASEHQNSLRPWEKERARIAEGEWGAVYDLTRPQ